MTVWAVEKVGLDHVHQEVHKLSHWKGWVSLLHLIQVRSWRSYSDPEATILDGPALVRTARHVCDYWQACKAAVLKMNKPLLVLSLRSVLTATLEAAARPIAALVTLGALLISLSPVSTIYMLCKTLFSLDSVVVAKKNDEIIKINPKLSSFLSPLGSTGSSFKVAQPKIKLTTLLPCKHSHPLHIQIKCQVTS